MPSRRAVFFDHDGGLDDFLSLLLLLTYEDVDLLGISITPADTLIEAAVPATRKILDLAGRSDVPVAASTAEPVHPFPMAWRMDAHKVNALPVLNRRADPAAPVSELAGQELLARTLVEADEPITLLWTGPLSDLAWALDHEPEAETNVAELLFMGGALDVPGNVQEPGHDGSAEWNIYWDPPSAKRVWDSPVPITLFPLDATDQVPVTDEFRFSFGRADGGVLSDLAGTIWAMTGGWELGVGLGNPYYCWDSLTTAALARPDLCTYREVRCDVVVGGPSEGRTVPRPGGRSVTAADMVDPAAFYAHCLETLRR